jgi:hypothetical protein
VTILLFVLDFPVLLSLLRFLVQRRVVGDQRVEKDDALVVEETVEVGVAVARPL